MVRIHYLCILIYLEWADLLYFVRESKARQSIDTFKQTRSIIKIWQDLKIKDPTNIPTHLHRK